MKYLIAYLIIIVVGVISITLIASHKHNEDCKWIAPLKTNYVMCSDGKVREK